MPPRSPAGFTSAYAGFTTLTQSSSRAGRSPEDGKAPPAAPRAPNSAPAALPRHYRAPSRQLYPKTSLREAGGRADPLPLPAPGSPTQPSCNRQARQAPLTATREGSERPGQTLRRLSPIPTKDAAPLTSSGARSDYSYCRWVDGKMERKPRRPSPTAAAAPRLPALLGGAGPGRGRT